MNYFTYNKGNLPEGAFRISPSGLSKFFDSTSEWYRTNLLGEDAAFAYSTASELGTCVHAIAAMYVDKQIDRKALNSYIDSLPEDVDKNLIREQVKPMSECLINSFLSTVTSSHSEQFIQHEVLPGIYAAGTVDLYDSGRAYYCDEEGLTYLQSKIENLAYLTANRPKKYIITELQYDMLNGVLPKTCEMMQFRPGILYDYKTMGSLDSARVPTKFPRAYWFQQACYAYILTKRGYQVDYMKLVYVTRSNINRVSETTGKPLKDYPSECHVLTEEVTPELLNMIEEVLLLVAHSVQHWKDFPTHRYLLAQDFRLRQ